MKTCNVIGLGYIGLPTAIVIANSDIEVFGVDINDDIIRSVNNCISHIKEPNIENELRQIVNKKKLKALKEPCVSDVFLIAVPTPFKSKTDVKIPSANLDYVFSAIKSILPFLKDGNLVILESTCPVGTTREIDKFIKNQSNLNNVDLAYCPERVLPGNILNELINNDRIIGGINSSSSKKASEFYSKFCKGSLHITSSEVAEITKLSENAYRDVNIAFANELSIICNKLNINHNEVIKLANYHPRVNILNPGCGVGGHCIAVDPWFIAESVPDSSLLIQTSREVNNQKKMWSLNLIIEESKIFEIKKKRKPIIGYLGLTYKNDVCDLRESPSEEIALNLLDLGYDLMTCEPNLKKHEKINLFDEEMVLSESDIIVIMVAHKEFRKIKFEKYRIIDFCGISFLNSTENKKVKI
tara:strand:+ start:18292 stop:19530 length:1239 start_codon:yes stop_codon:yes gene_type:complete